MRALPRRPGGGVAAEARDKLRRAPGVAFIKQAQFGRALGEWYFARESREHFVSDVDANALGFEHVLQVMDFVQVQRGINRLHGRKD